MRFGTKLILGGNIGDDNTGTLSTPIYHTSTFDQKKIDGDIKYDYARSGNPTREALENLIRDLEGGFRGFAFSSGIAAISAVLSIFHSNDHILITQDVYGGTHRLASKFFTRYSVDFEFVDPCDYDNIEKSIKNNTKAIYIETPSNPLLRITDIERIVKIAKENNLLVIVDNTFMSPYLQRPLELGADIVIHSATKFLNGHSDVIAGLVVVKDKDLANEIYFIQNGCGAVLGPQDCWLLIRGIKTLKVRLDYQQKNALLLAEWLSKHENVETVYYPGLVEHPGREVHLSQADGPGAVLSFKTKDIETATRFMNQVKCGAVAVSLGGVETIVSYPVKMSHAAIPKDERERLGITDNLIRVSVGLEDIEDLIEDFNNAL